MRKTVRTAAGDLLSEQDLEALADEAERGYDPSRWRAVPVGRPSLGARGTSPRVQVRVDPDLAVALKARAREENRSVSDLARTALGEYLERTR